MAKVENSVVVDRPADTVWKFYTNLANLPTLDPFILEARQDSPGPLGVGSTVTLRMEKWTLAMRVTQFDPGRMVTFEALSPGSLRGSTDSYVFEPMEGKTKVSETMEVKSTGFFGLAGSFFGKAAEKDVGIRLGALKRVMEATAG